MKKLIEQNVFLIKYNIEKEKFDATTLKWEDLELIYQDYCEEIPRLESSAIYIFNSLMKTPNVHSVRYRIKDAEHVVEKIIRKRIKDSHQIISLENYKSELTDLIGLRALHLFKEEWNTIHEFITSTWDLKEKPVANFRYGDSVDYLNKFQEFGCEVKEHQFGYRSVHYIVETKPAKNTFYAEIQVRTIFEEAWSEIDHTIRYPYDQDNLVFGQFLLILNRLAGSADEMGTFIQFLKKELQSKEDNFRQEMTEKDHLINGLETKIKELKLEKSDNDYLTEGLEKLKKPELSIIENINNKEYLSFSYLSTINKIHNIDLSAISALSKFSIPLIPSLSIIENINTPALSALSKFSIPQTPNLLILDKITPIEKSKKKIKLPNNLPKNEE